VDIGSDPRYYPAVRLDGGIQAAGNSCFSDAHMPSRSMNISNGQVALVVEEAERFSAVIAFSLRYDGRSLPPMHSLNFSTSQGDSPENVRDNYRVLGERLDIDTSGIATCRQVHGDTILVVESPPVSPPEADAIISVKPGVFPAVKTADCVPVLLLDPVRRISAAVHVGWRGAVLRVLNKVLVAMETRFGSRPSDLVAALGPAIGPCCYEVDDRVLTPFRKAVPQADRFITASWSGAADTPERIESRRIDLVGANRFELTSGGVRGRNIYTADFCTSCRPDLFFSYRRDGAASGRHIAVTGFRA